MSRKRTRESLVQQLCEPCGSCGGRGYTRTAESVCHEVFRAILRDSERRGQHVPGATYLVRADGRVVDRLLDENAADVEALVERVRQPIRFQVEPSYGIEEFDVVLVQDLN